MIIDFHTHCFPDTLAPRAIAKLGAMSQYPPQTDGTMAQLKVSMRQAGIDYSVLLNTATNAKQTTNVNNFAIAANRERGIISFGSVHPDYADYKSELQRLHNAGIKGIKFHPDFQDFDVDDKRMYPIYECIAQMGFIMLFHCGHDMDVRPMYHCTPQTFMRVARDFAGAKIVGAHLGGQDMWDEVFAHTIGQDVYLDTAYAFGWLNDEQLRRVLNTHNPDKLLFGTDTPWQTQKADVDMMRRRIMDVKLFDKIMGENAAKLLGIQ